MTTRMKVLRVALATAACLMMSRAGEACSCSHETPSYDVYTAVFLGKVTAIRQVELPSRGQLLRHKLVEFSAEAVWKGPRTAQQRVYTGLGGPDCGAEFKVGERYLVTASEDPFFDADPSDKTNRLFTSRCSSTAPVGRAPADNFTELNRSHTMWVPPARKFPWWPFW
jgi:hypothetical protein